MQKNKVGPLSHTIYKINSKWIKYLNITAKTIKLLAEKVNLHDFGFGNESLQNTEKETKEKIDKLDYIDEIKFIF